MRQRLGQHFLKNQAAIKTIVAALDLKRNDTIIEIGAGHGELTFPLAKRCAEVGCFVVAIEKDSLLAGSLKLRIEKSGEKARILHADALKFVQSSSQLSMPDSQSAKLVGNLPYYLTGRLLRIIGERTAKPARCVFTLQREVAERLAAQPPRMNRLAAIIQFWAHPRILGRLSPDDFTPRPEIDSAIVCLDTLREHSFEMSKYSQVVRILYRQPRKTVVNNLASGLALSREEILKKLWAASIPPTARPQDVSTQELIRLARLLSHGGNLS